MSLPSPSHRRLVLVTGATGTVGSAVVATLAKTKRYEIHALVRRPIVAQERIVPRLLDLTTPDFHEPLRDTEYDFIVHCAQPRYDQGLGTTGQDFDLRVVQGLERLCTPKTKRLIYTSGVWIYGHQLAGQQINESSPLHPISYATDRLRTLQYLRTQSPHPWVEAVLPSLVYGATGPFQNICDTLIAGSALVVDDESILWSVIEQADVGGAYLRLMESTYPERSFVMAELEPVPIIQLYRLIAAELAVPFQGTAKEKLARAVRKEDLEVMTMSQPVDSSLFRSRTGWQSRHEFGRRAKELVKQRAPGL